METLFFLSLNSKRLILVSGKRGLDESVEKSLRKQHFGTAHEILLCIFYSTRQSYRVWFSYIDLDIIILFSFFFSGTGEKILSFSIWSFTFVVDRLIGHCLKDELDNRARRVLQLRIFTSFICREFLLFFLSLGPVL